jgi:hypothetical protein
LRRELGHAGLGSYFDAHFRIRRDVVVLGKGLCPLESPGLTGAERGAAGHLRWELSDTH